MPPLSRYEYKQLLDVIEETIIHTEADTATLDRVERLAETYNVRETDIYAVIQIEYPNYYPEELRRERELDADRLKEMPPQITEQDRNGKN